MTSIQARSAGHAAAEIIVADAAPSRCGSPCANDTATELERGFDLLFFLREMDILADELSKLAPSMDRTALELRLAQMRQVVEFRHKQRMDKSNTE